MHVDSAWLMTLMATPGIGAASVRAILRADGDPPTDVEDLLVVLERARAQGVRIRLPDRDTLTCAADEAKASRAEAAALGISALGICDAEYPASLREIDDSPPVLYVKGSVAWSDGIAVVGTRRPTEYGARCAHRIGRRLAEHGITVVSGLAMGCDTAAHEGCVDVEGTAIAVLAHGLDRVYPVGNTGLAERIVETGGCLVSEQPIGTTPKRHAFVARNRIQVGLSVGVVVVETGVEGGTMHTIRDAMAASRPVACVEHPQQYHDAPETEGTRALLADGRSAPLRDRDSLLEFLHGIDVLASRVGCEDAPHDESCASSTGGQGSPDADGTESEGCQCAP